MSAEAQAFDAIVADLDGPAYVVTTAAAGERDATASHSYAPHDGRCERSDTRQLALHEIGDIEAGHQIRES